MILNKDKSILQLLDLLGLEERGWAVNDHWEADLCAIGITSTSSKGRLVYVSTFDKPEGKFDYECEALRCEAEGDTEYEIVDEGVDVGFHDLVEAVERHLDVPG